MFYFSNFCHLVVSLLYTITKIHCNSWSQNIKQSYLATLGQKSSNKDALQLLVKNHQTNIPCNSWSQIIKQRYLSTLGQKSLNKDALQLLVKNHQTKIHCNSWSQIIKQRYIATLGDKSSNKIPCNSWLYKSSIRYMINLQYKVKFNTVLDTTKKYENAKIDISWLFFHRFLTEATLECRRFSITLHSWDKCKKQWKSLTKFMTKTWWYLHLLYFSLSTVIHVWDIWFTMNSNET